jgi:hypothetical protein
VNEFEIEVAVGVTDIEKDATFVSVSDRCP